MITKRTKLFTGMLCATALMLPAVGLMAFAPPGTALAGPGGGHDDFRGHAQHDCKALRRRQGTLPGRAGLETRPGANTWRPSTT